MPEHDEHLLPRFQRQYRHSGKRRGKRRYKLGEGKCRLCERSAKVRRLTRHHLVPISKGGSWRNENIIPLCRICHTAVDAAGSANRQDRLIWRSMLRRRLLPGEISHVRRVMGEEWLTWEYPTMRQLADRRLDESLVLVPRGKIATRAYRRELGRLTARATLELMQEDE